MTKPAPDWAPRYWRFKSLSHHEARNILCGLAPDPGNDTPEKVFRQTNEETPADFWARQRKQTADDYARDELRRVDADRYIEDWIRGGELHILEPPNARILQKVKRILTDEEFRIVTRAVEDHLSYSKAGRYATDELIRVARSHPDLVPDCPLPPAAGDSTHNLIVTEELKEHRRAVVKRELDERGITQKEFCEEHKISETALLGMINGDRVRFGNKTEARLLRLLRCPAVEWNLPKTRP